MELDFSDVCFLKDPDPSMLAADYVQFLLSLSAPTIIDITGIDKSRTRVVTTLLHGNEPSGFIAIHRWLSEYEKTCPPVTNLRFIIASVEAASTPPLFSRRFLDDGKDLNRCFGTDKTHSYYQRAKIIDNAIREVKPELIVDLHNTSGASPAFAVGHLLTPDVLALTSLFSPSIILSNIRLGALMEQDFGCPIVTIECGGSEDQQAHEVAFGGITLLAKQSDMSTVQQHHNVDVVVNPMRLQLKPHTSLSYAEQDEGHIGVTLKSSIEKFNYGSANKGQMLGWLDDKGLNNLTLINEENVDVTDQYFAMRENQLICATNLTIYMATTKKNIAISDCLFYVVKRE